MREMKDSGVPWIGEIPKGWERTSLLNVLRKKITDGPHETPLFIENEENGIPFVSIDSLGNSDKIDFSVVKKYISKEDYLRYTQKTVIEEGDILFTKAATIGKTAIVGKECFMVWSPLAIIKTNENKASNRFVYYLLNCDRLITSVKLTGSMNTQINVGMRELEKIQITVPPIKEQQSIAKFLDVKCAEIDAILEKTQASIEEYKKLKQSVITEAVTKGVRGEREVKKTGTAWIDTIPCDWEFKRFKFIANNLFKGNGITKDQVFLDGDTPCVRYGEIYSKYDRSFDKCFSLTRLDIQDAPRFFKQGDILFAGTGELIEEIGKNIIYLGNEQCLAGGDIIVAQHKHNGVFLNYALNSSYAQAQKSYGKAKLKVVHISASEIGDVLVALPPKDEQAEIAAYLAEKCAAIDSLITSKEALITELEAYKKSLIYEYVTGKKEVPA